MRYIDIAVAALIGASALTGISVWTPGPYDAAAKRSSLHAALQGELQGFVQSQGMVWFLRSTSGAFCSSLARASNSTVVFSGDIGGSPCGDPPPPGAVAASLHFTLAAREYELTAWSNEGA